MTRPRLLDLFCGAGGAAVGYHRAGFTVVGVDLQPQPRYPFRFIQTDALTFPLDGFAVIHASPPCQADLRGLSVVNRGLGRSYEHRSLLIETRRRLHESDAIYVIEQPEQGAEMLAPVRLCGSSFGLPVRRHRLFESNVALLVPPCEHDRFREKKYWTSWVKNGERQRATVVQVYGNGGERTLWGPALAIDWMTDDELRQALPPTYTEYIGRQLLAVVQERAA